MKQKIYIAGKVTGLPITECTMNFGLAQKQIENLGHEAVNPLAVVNDWKCPWEKAMKLCIVALMDCDAIFVLDNYINSSGAMMELHLAKRLNIPVYFEASKIDKPQKMY